MRVRVKICGITRVEDGICAARNGADAIGLVFYPPSPRAIDWQQARAVVNALPPFVSTVGLFVNADRQEVEQVLDRVALDLLQFHGDETPDYCSGFSRPWIKAVRMRPDVDLHAEAERYHQASALLVDAYRPGTPGGTGEVFDWRRIPAQLQKPLVLAGGLNPENVSDAIEAVHPWAVDVSGGVEQDKGVKSHRKVAQFIESAENTGQEETCE